MEFALATANIIRESKIKPVYKPPPEKTYDFLTPDMDWGIQPYLAQIYKEKAPE